MANPHPSFRRLERLSLRLREAEAKADGIRHDLYDAVAKAREEGMTISDVARATGVTRQRAQQLLRQLEKR